MSDADFDKLSVALRAWKVDPQIPASFRRGVWQRISTRQTARQDAFWPKLVAWMSGQLVRPQYAVAFVIIGLAASVGAAHLHAQETNTKMAKRLEARYAASVDPLAMSAGAAIAP